ncbi:hypothetical protein MMC13_007300 [Lambiella insularis]|nr:hypothetical protein [Lambiella insularis]
MYFASSVLPIFLLFTSTFSLPLTPTPRSTSRTIQSRPLVINEASSNSTNSSQTAPVYSDNWSGAVIHYPPPGQLFTSVSGIISVPSVSAGSGPGPWSGSAWVGIDGASYQKAILQTGIDFNIDAAGKQTFSAWYEWFPQPMISFGKFPMSIGDEIAMQVYSTNSTTGVAQIENRSTGQIVTHNLTAPGNDSALGGQNAEWIVEDYSSGGLVPLANWGNVTFRECVAATDGLDVLGVGNATLWDIRNKQAGGATKVVTNSQILDNYSVGVAYI